MFLILEIHRRSIRTKAYKWKVIGLETSKADAIRLAQDFAGKHPDYNYHIAEIGAGYGTRTAVMVIPSPGSSMVLTR